VGTSGAKGWQGVTIGSEKTTRFETGGRMAKQIQGKKRRFPGHDKVTQIEQANLLGKRGKKRSKSKDPVLYKRGHPPKFES